MKLNVCLIHLPSLYSPGSLSYFESSPPIGLAYIAASLQKENVNLQIIDAVAEGIDSFSLITVDDVHLILHGLQIDQILNKIRINTHLVAIGNMFLHEFKLLQQLSEVIKEKFPNIVQVVGGENATAYWDIILSKINSIDYCVLGEGEEIIVEMIRNLAEQKSLESIASVAFIRKGRPWKNKRRSRIVNISDIAPPAWELFNIEPYLEKHYSGGVNRGRSMPLMSSRGCPYACTFCSAENMWSQSYYVQNPVKFVNELEKYYKLYRLNNIELVDLTSLFSKKWIRGMRDEIVNRKIKVTWQLPQGTRSEAIDRESARWLYESGCRNIGFAAESGSIRMLKAMRKNVKTSVILQAIKHSNRAGIKVSVFILLGLPGEKLYDVFLSYKFMLKCIIMGSSDLAALLFSPYPGSYHWRQLRDQGKIEFNTSYIYSSLLRASPRKIKSYNENMGKITLVFFQYFFSITFYTGQFCIRPWRFLRLLSNFLKKEENTILDKILSIKRKQHKLKKQLVEND